MKQRLLIASAIISLLLVVGSGCSNSESMKQEEEALEEVAVVKKDNEQLQSKLTQLELANKELQRQLDDIQSMREYEGILFDGQRISIGDTIKGFKVTDISFGGINYECAVLEKEFTLKGKLVV